MEGAPLDSATRPLCVQSPKTRLPQLRHQTILQNLLQEVTQFSEKFLGIDYALLPNREGNQKQKHKKQPWSNVECFAFGGWTCLWHVSMQTAMYQRIGNMPKACPYVMTQFVPSPIVADINHRKPKQTKRTVPLVCTSVSNN